MSPRAPAPPDDPLDKLCINTIRTLSMDAVQAANSGHPGTPMAMAPVVYCLWQRFLRFDPEDPIWPNRDRFVLSIGRASILLYATLHLAGVKAVNKKYERLGELSVSLEEIKRFRQLNSTCPGHPEYRWTSGIETTTGPLGQGVAVEQASTFGWERYVGSTGAIIRMRTFGASAPLKELQRKFWFTPDRVVTAAKEQLQLVKAK